LWLNMSAKYLNYTLTMARWLSCLHSVACTAASQQEGHGFDSRMGRCWLCGGSYPLDLQCSGGLSPWPFYVEFACVHKGFPPLKTPTKRTEHLVHLVPGHCSWGVLEEGQSGMGKSRVYSHSDLRPACVCVCPVSPPYIHVCVAVCRLCNKKLTEVSLV